MKKILKSISVLFLISSLFFACTTGTNENTNSTDNNNSSTTSNDNNSGSSLSNDTSNFTANTNGTSVDFVKNMGMGWNLGNTLDASNENTTSNQGLSSETYWGQPKTTENMIKAVQAAGFKTIRIPVSWHNHISNKSGSTYTIDSEWMARVKTIVDWSLDAGMCVILNVHHDNMAASVISGRTSYGYALSTNSTVQETSKAYLSSVWTQIATTFASYDEKLVFEVLNEPRDVGGECWGNEWWTTNSEAYTCITDYEKTCIDAIRAVSGNENRYIMVPGYAASGSDKTELSCYTMPTDTATNKLILSAHAYSPYNFAMYSSNDSNHTSFTSNDASELTSIFNYLKTNYIDKGIGVVMGEASASNKGNLSARVSWATDYYTKATNAGIPVVLWDNGASTASTTSGEQHGYLNRSARTWYFPSIINAMYKATYGSEGTLSTDSDSNTDSSSSSSESDSDTTSGTELLSSALDGTAWGVNTTISAISNAVEGSTITFTTEAASASTSDGTNIIQIFDVSGKSWEAFNLTGSLSSGSWSSNQITANASEGTVVWTLSSSDASTISSSGFAVQPYGIKITSIVFK